MKDKFIKKDKRKRNKEQGGTFSGISTTLKESLEEKQQKKLSKHKSWMALETLQLMEERRKHKHNQVLYKDLNKNKKNRRYCNEAKEEFLPEECAFMVQGWSLHPENAHERIRVVTGRKKYGSSSIKGLRKRLTTSL